MKQLTPRAGRFTSVTEHRVKEKSLSRMEIQTPDRPAYSLVVTAATLPRLHDCIKVLLHSTRGEGGRGR